jgi:DNA primase
LSIPESLIEEIRQRADLVEVVSEHTRLKRSGKTFRGPCPLHGGDGPNFSVDPAKGFYKCFVCGEGGTVYTFLQRHLGMNFVEAVRHVAERVGIEIPDPRQEQRPADPNAHLYEINAFAAEWFARQLREAGGAGARAYLERRGIGAQPVERFGLGWAPESWSALLDAAKAHRIREEDLLQLGLVKVSERSGSLYDAFRGRVIFPIRDMGGRVIAFGGRVLGDEVPKYLNSPETPVYHKGDVLYGLGWSRGAIRKEETALVVEGYMDYVALASHGVENVVAPLGTALTQGQAELIARYARRVILLYDSDEAGLKATFRSGDELLRAGVEVLVATLPDGEDPDSLVRARGAAALGRYLDDAVDVLDRKISILERRGAFASVAGVRRAIDRLLPTVRAASDEVLRGVYIARIASKTGVSRETLEREVVEAGEGARRPTRGEQRGAPLRGAPARPPARGESAPPPAMPGRASGPERILLLLLLRDESWVDRAAEKIGPADFRDPVYRAVFEGLLHTAGRRDAEGRWLGEFPAEVIPVVEALRGDPETEHLTAPEQMFEASVRELLARPLQERLRQIEEELRRVPVERHAALMEEKQQVSRTMRERNLPLRPGTLRSRPPAE